MLVRFGSGPAPQASVAEPEEIAEASPTPPPGTSYGPLPAWATKQNATAGLERLGRDAVASEGMKLDGIPGMGLTRSPSETAEAFDVRARAAIEAEVEKRTAKTRGPLLRKIESLENHIEQETRELERDRAESARSKTYSAIDVGASILTTILGGRKGSIGAAGRAGARGYGRIQRAAENVKESEKKIADWTAERDSLKAEMESAEAGERAKVEAEAGRREEVRVPVNRTDVRALEWYVLWS